MTTPGDLPVGGQRTGGAPAAAGGQPTGGAPASDPTTVAPGSHRARPAWTRGQWAVLAGVCVLALGWRLASLVGPGAFASASEYDDAVMYTAAAALLAGDLPYRDVVVLHPPGAVLALVPFAALGQMVGDGVALGVARAFFACLGAVNTGLVAVLLRRHGAIAMLAGAGLYAAWLPVVATERAPVLEPLLNLGLLLALLVGRSRRSGSPVLAGAVLGLAATVKVWAAVDLVVVVLMTGAARGRRAAARFAGGAALAGLAVVAPFVVLTGGALWDAVVLAQLGRPHVRVGLADRARLLSPFGDSGSDLPALLFAGAAVVLAVCCAVPLVRVLARRLAPRAWPEPAWWSLLALTHLGLLVVAPTAYYHYVTWAAAPMALVLGALAGELAGARVSGTPASGAVLDGTLDGTRGGGAVLDGAVLDGTPGGPAETPAGGRASAGRVRAVAVAGAVVALVAVFTAYSAATTTPQPDRAALVAWAAGHECVGGSPEALVRADAVSPNAAHGCGFFADPFGVGLTLTDAGTIDSDADVTTGNPRWREAAWANLSRADAVILPADEAAWWFEPQMRAEFDAEFVRVGEYGALGLWERSAAGVG